MLRAAVIGLLLTAHGSRVPDEYQPTRQAFLELINSARGAVGARPLRLSAVLSKIAQSRADEIGTGHDVPGAAAEEDARRAQKLGYEARVISEVTAEADGNIETVVREWQTNGGKTAAELVGGDYREMGLGVSLRRNIPLYVLILGIPWEDFFHERTDALKDLERVREEMLERINRERTSRGLAPLRRHPRLDEAAQAHADDMFRRGYYSHDTPEGKTALQRARAKGYQAQHLGENIARGQYSLEEVMTGWMESPTHREHLLSSVFNDVGFGLAFGKNSGYQIFWVQDFGRPKGRERI